MTDQPFLGSRLPELSIIITLDSKLPGAFSMDDVMQAGDSSHKKQLQDIKKTLKYEEPINIQFTSVGIAYILAIGESRQ